ncbi:response regulator transcription factor [Parasulfuritortus cantonensis]|uniref:Response regulator transcription factor n=1 Tax=Parasulfuritortus cantonensis TaxID=2528202 RepID=A0A4R1BCJ1_9PROT|nr:response regulator transcription factor [Parasulfuritortus cantonensis]TCJ14756.1 response regulator transcription factor [Parasulfuritortus cantonensis]
MNPIRILIIDDHPLIRLGVRHSVESLPDLTVSQECADLACVHDWLNGGGAADVAVLDRSLPDGDGLDLVPVLKAAGMKVIILTVEDGDEEIRAAIETGVDGYLLKSSDTEQISHAIGVVLQDAGAFPPAVLQKLYRAGAAEDPLSRLSARELEIAEYVAQGHSNKVIGAKLNLSDNTVRNHLANIMQKLDFHNRVQVATLVLQHLKKTRRA